MLSKEELIDALYEYISKYGIGSLLCDHNSNPLTQIEPIPPFLVNSNEAKHLLTSESRTLSIDYEEDADLNTRPVKEFLDAPLEGNINAYFEKDPKAKEDLQAFLCSYLGYPDLTVSLDAENCNIFYTELANDVFPFSLCNARTKLYVNCSLPGREDSPTSTQTTSATIEYIKSSHSIIGPDYSTISNIVISTPKENHIHHSPKGKTNSPSVQPRKIDRTFLYKAGPALSPLEIEALADGSTSMLLSRKSEMRTLTKEFLDDAFCSDGSFCNTGMLQPHILKLMTRLMTEGKLLYKNIKIEDGSISHELVEEEDNEITIRYKFSAHVSFEKYQNVEIEIEFEGTLRRNVVNSSVYYDILGYCVHIGSKNGNLLKDLTGTDEYCISFFDIEQDKPVVTLADNFTKTFSKYHEAAINNANGYNVKPFSEISDKKDNPETQPTVASNTSSAAKVETSISPTDKPLAGIQDKEDNPETQPTVASNTSSAAKVETSISPTDKPLVGIQDKKDNPKTQPTVASNTSSATKVKTSISPTDKPLAGIQDKKDNPETQTYVDELPQVNFFEKPSLLRRILGIPVSIVKFTFNVIVKCITFPFSLVARCFSKVVGLFCSKPSSTYASLNSPKQTTAVDSNTSKGQSTETDGKVAPAKDKGGTSPAEHHKQAASAGLETQIHVGSDQHGTPSTIIKTATLSAAGKTSEASSVKPLR